MAIDPKHETLVAPGPIIEEIDNFKGTAKKVETPLFPEHIYKILPKFLKEASSFFDQGRDKDVFLASTLTVLSGCMPGVKFQHDGKTYWNNLFLFIIAPAASGKGKMNYGKFLAQPIQRKYIKENDLKKETYQLELSRYRATPAKDRLYIDEPLEPDYQYLFIPANSSSASFVETMARMTSSILFESEADTLGNTLKQDWSGYSDVLRKAFEHETHSQNRKGSGNYKEIENPCLSVALSGTPGQLKGIIPNTEDGLFSRFMFYYFDGDEEFRSVFGTKSKPIPYADQLEPYSKELLQIYEKCQNWEEVRFSWKPEQENELQDLYAKWTKYYVRSFGSDVKSIVFRSAIIVTRIASILTVLRTWEHQDYSNKQQVCSGKDFDIAIALAETFIEHSMKMHSHLMKRDPTESFPLKKKQFFLSLPDSFETNEAERIGDMHGIKDRTVRKYLRDWDNHGLLVKIDQGKYEKPV
ncbi:DUF3987 domain-containing protein [uncultured Roseivirga sp.]|uniref:DUF3987 domain-containing protein n=1 Tax=uncultured Roseivirga sp. TaxID=543088 RepID=UPI0030DD54D3|tara:strand:+ start:4588 stop:5994 length:1407 start_codon:yes stop_codon:yes gene_type:complete